MLGLLSGLGRGALESKYEQKLLQRKRFEEWQKQQMELSNEEKAYISNLPRYQRALELANEKLGIAENANALPHLVMGYSVTIQLTYLRIGFAATRKSMLAMNLAVI